MRQSLNGIVLAFCIAVFASIPATAAEPLTGKVVSVTDGDTVRVLDAANVQHKVRLNGIDAPERGQPFGTVARDRLAGLVMGKAVTVRNDGRDRWGRTLGRIEIEGQDVNHRMVADGMAWHYVAFNNDARWLPQSVTHGPPSVACGPTPSRCRRGSGVRPRRIAGGSLRRGSGLALPQFKRNDCAAIGTNATLGMRRRASVSS